MLTTSVPELCDQLRELHRQRQDLHRAEKSMTLRIRAKCRRLCAIGGAIEGETDTKFLARVRKEADVLYSAMSGKGEHPYAVTALATCQPFIEARSLLESERKKTEKQMAEAVHKLPVMPWVESVRGLGALSLASIVGEAGDLSNYANPAKLWKRMGLAVINGERQQRKPGIEAREHGYDPSRRSVMWTIGDSMFRSGGAYADLCRERKEFEVAKAEAAGLTVVPAAKIPAASKSEYMSHGHIHNRAKRWMEKRVLRDLWRAWRDADPMRESEWQEAA